MLEQKFYMKKEVLVCILVVGAVIAAFVRQQLRYPEAWDRIQVGISRQEVYDLNWTAH